MSWHVVFSEGTGGGWVQSTGFNTEVYTSTEIWYMRVFILVFCYRW